MAALLQAVLQAVLQANTEQKRVTEQQKLVEILELVRNGPKWSWNMDLEHETLNLYYFM